MINRAECTCNSVGEMIKAAADGIDVGQCELHRPAPKPSDARQLADVVIDGLRPQPELDAEREAEAEQQAQAESFAADVAVLGAPLAEIVRDKRRAARAARQPPPEPEQEHGPKIIPKADLAEALRQALTGADNDEVPVRTVEVSESAGSTLRGDGSGGVVRDQWGRPERSTDYAIRRVTIPGTSTPRRLHR